MRISRILNSKNIIRKSNKRFYPAHPELGPPSGIRESRSPPGSYPWSEATGVRDVAYEESSRAHVSGGD
jgi:hypothetical protein